MENSAEQSLEQALAKTEADAAATLKAADTLTRSLRRFHAAAKSGNLRELRASVEDAEGDMAGLRQQFANAKESWRFDEEPYLANGLYSKEVIAAGQQIGLRIFERDDRLYCYPALIRVSSRDKAVYIDKKVERRIRPSVLAARLRELQRKPPRFRSEQFLAALHEAYKKLAAARGKDLLEMSPSIPLVDIYRLLTLLPGQSQDYAREEFTRDIYLLDRSGVNTTRDGAKVTFPFTGRAPQRETLTVIDEEGGVKRYYGITFTEG